MIDTAVSSFEFSFSCIYPKLGAEETITPETFMSADPTPQKAPTKACSL